MITLKRLNQLSKTIISLSKTTPLIVGDEKTPILSKTSQPLPLLADVL
jgi:hypothetical protein